MRTTAAGAEAIRDWGSAGWTLLGCVFAADRGGCPRLCLCKSASASLQSRQCWTCSRVCLVARLPCCLLERPNRTSVRELRGVECDPIPGHRCVKSAVYALWSRVRPGSGVGVRECECGEAGVWPVCLCGASALARAPVRRWISAPDRRGWRGGRRRRRRRLRLRLAALCLSLSLALVAESTKP